MTPTCQRDAIRRLEIAAMFGELAGHGQLEQALGNAYVKRRDAKRVGLERLRQDPPRYEHHLSRQRAKGKEWRAAHGAKTRPSDADARAIRELWHGGMSQMEIACRFGLTQPAVSLIVRGLSHAKAGGPLRVGASTRRASGTHNGKAKLTPETVRRARSMWPGQSMRSIARELGVAYKAVWCLLHGKTWTSVPKHD